MRGIRSTVALAVVFVALFAYVYFVESRRPAEGLEPAKPKVFVIEADTIQALHVINDRREQTTLEKRDGAWHVIEPIQDRADEAGASGIATGLENLEVQRVVEDVPSDFARYGLAEPRIELGFKVEAETDFHRLLIGDKTATGSDIYAKRSDEERVFLIAGYLDSTFNHSTFDLRDKSILKFDRATVDQIEIKMGAQVVALTRSTGTEWSMTVPWPVRADYGSVESLIGQLSTSQMQEIVAQEVDDPATYGLDQPRATVMVGSGSSRATLLIGRSSDDANVYARDVSRQTVFTVESSILDEIQKPAVDYRSKDLFAFRLYNAARFEITRSGETLAFEKTAGDGEISEETWRQVTPSEAEMDRSKVDDMLSKFSGLRTDSFAPTRTDTGLDAPFATVVVRYGEDQKEERVVFGRSGDRVYGLSGDEPGAAVLNAAAIDEALKAVDAVGP